MVLLKMDPFDTPWTLQVPYCFRVTKLMSKDFRILVELQNHHRNFIHCNKCYKKCIPYSQKLLQVKTFANLAISPFLQKFYLQIFAPST